ncbi:DUF2164 domain-containing protein [Litorilituus lipolyticus]|uniref:DUF2164 domain-containing protein n=1 Tax=Litorilituus lipolyticus TaxID=2491017 RepID=A0A502LF76_9GAMM|nr:DUF2164 domain-containing protein [Litorilituus lipolyticus]TPH18637.1 DUF2164 domain-containing protein [Litorilituus lipolyticus]
MAEITFNQQEKEQLVLKIQNYFNDELAQDIGQFDAEFLLDFFAKEVGGYFYNRGVFDAQAIVSDKLENVNEVINEALFEIEKPVK